MDLQETLFSFSGRINRQPYWLIGIGAAVATALVSQTIGAVLPEILALPGVIVMSVASMWIGLALGVKRAHDRGRSGWFVLLFLIPLLNLWPMIELYFLRGTVGQNEFGADPLA